MEGDGSHQHPECPTRGIPDTAFSLPDQAPPMDIELAAVRWAKGQEFGLEFLIMGREEEERLDRFVGTLQSGTSH